MSDRFRRLGLALGLLTMTSMGVAGEEAKPPRTRPVVAAFERFGDDRKAAPFAPGVLLLGELNCTSCHQAVAAQLAHLDPKRAPILDGVGSRVRVSYLRAFLADPQGTKPGTTMPDPFAGLGAAEKGEKVEALVQFLATTGNLAEKAPNPRAIAAGKALYGQVGCLACHGEASGQVPLGDLAAKYGIPSLSAFLLDPLKVRPSGRMPSLNLGGDEATNLANYLLKDLSGVNARPCLDYAYYEGDWQALPDFDALRPVSEGRCASFDPAMAGCANSFAMRFLGRFKAPRDGQYTFHIGSDDGSRLSIDGRKVVDCDGVHPFQSKDGVIRLDKGEHRVVVDYFQGGGEAELAVELEGPETGRRDLATLLIPLDKAPKPEVVKAAAPAFTPDPALESKGRELFASVGCSSCHQLAPIESKAMAMPLAKLKGDGGCLSASVPKGLPDFHLDASQRTRSPRRSPPWRSR